MSRAVFNVELVLPLLLASWSRPVAAATLAIAWLLDFAVNQAPSFHFASPLEFLRSASFLSDVDLTDFLSLDRAVFVLPFLLCAALALRWRPRPTPWIPALTVFTVLSLLDVANGSSMLLQRGTRLISANIANGPAIMLAYKAWNERHQPPVAFMPLPADASATALAGLDGWTAVHSEGSALVVLVESMGIHRDPSIQAWLRDQLIVPEIAPRYYFRQAAVPFHGSTTAAELRELCGLSGTYRAITPAVGSGCLPARLLARSWNTVGLHGFSSRMFDRRQWWPLIGLRTRRFAEDLAADDERRCGGAFAGLCDARIMRLAVADAAPPRSLVYALTLNSHLPLAPIEVPQELRVLCDVAGTGMNVCRLTATIGVALRALGDSLAATARAPAVIVVGDHAPPFSTLLERAQYSQQDVPAFILMPR